jgi:hypothetical protein
MFICFQASKELFVINVLEIANNCWLVNYRACMWGFVSSGMLKLCPVQEFFAIHSESVHLLEAK